VTGDEEERRPLGEPERASPPGGAVPGEGVPGEADQSTAEAGEMAPEEEREPDTPFEEFAASWVPPWARSSPQLIIEPAADYTAEQLAAWQQGPAVEEDEPPNPDDFEPGMSDAELRGALEAVLLVVDEPVTNILLAQVLEEPTARVDATLHALAGEYAVTGRGFELRRAAGGWRLYTRSEYAAFVERFILDGQQTRLTQAALETLAVVAYKQPVTRSRISAIRGVNCDGVIKTLLNRGLLEEAGTEPESGAHLYRTTQLFLEKLGIDGVEELPPLAPFLPDNVDEIDIGQR